MVKALLYISSLIVFFSCSRGERHMLGSDVRLYKGSPVYEVAKAIKKDDTVKIKKLLEGKPDSIINFQEKTYGQSLLEWAVDYDYYPSAKILAELGANPNLQSYNGTSAFIHAAGKYNSDFLKLLLQYGGNVNAVAQVNEPQHLRTPLIAASRKSLENVKLLIQAGADPHYVYTSYNGKHLQSPLEYAFNGNNIDVINYLVMEAKIDVKRAYGARLNGDSIYIQHFMRDLRFPLDSEKYKKKMLLVEYLKTQGIDYWETPIPKNYYQIHDAEYLRRY